MLRGPILPTMLKLALPTIVVLVAQTFVGVAETYFVGFLGTDALALIAERSADVVSRSRVYQPLQSGSAIRAPRHEIA